MANKELKAKLVIDAQTSGAPGVVDLADGMEQLAHEARLAGEVLANRELLGVRAHADVQKEIAKTRAAFEQLKASGKLTQAELAQAAMKTEERIRELGQQTNGWKESLGKARGELAALAASGAGLAVVAKQAIDFESAMADVAKVTNGTDAQMQALGAQIKEMTRTIPLAATELAAMAAAGGQLGVPIEKLEAFVQLSAQMATAFGMSAEQAGEAVAKLSNVFDMPIEKVRGLGDAINALGNNMAAKEKDIVEVLARIGGTAKQFGLSAQQAASLAAAMLSLGVSSEVAGTGINAILSKLQTASVQGKDFQLALAEMGVSAVQLAKDIRDNPQRALSEFFAALQKLDGAKQAEVLSRLFGQEYQDDVARLVGGLQQYQKALSLVGDAAATSGAMQKEFEKRAQTTEAQLKLLNNAVSEAGINLGSVFLPMIRATAEGLRDGAQAIASFAEKNPALAGAAAALLTLGANVSALTLGFKALQVVATKALPGVVTGAAGAATAVGGLLTVVRTALGPLTALWASFEAGQYAGQKLKENFVEVERAGIALAAGLTRAAARSQAAWEMMQAPFTDDTVEAAQERLQVRLAQIDDEYSQMFASAGKAKEAVQAQAQAADGAAQANAKVSAEVQAVAEKMAQLKASAQAAGLGAQSVSEQLERVFAQSIAGAQSVAVLAQLRDKLQEAQAAGQLTADAAARLRVQLDQVGAAQGAKELVAQFYALKDGADGVQGAVDKLVASFKFDDEASIAAFARALQDLGSAGVLSAKQVNDAWQQALGKLDAQQLHDFSMAVRVAFAQGTLSAQEFAQANEQVLTASFDKLGVNAAQALGKISTGAQEAINAVDLVAESAKDAGVGVQESARAIEMAFAAAIPKADSLEAIDALEKQLKAMGEAGKISAEGIQRTQAALDKQRATIEAQIPGIQSLEEGLRNLGVKPQKELAALAASAKQAFDAVKASGTATPRELSEAWKAMAEAAIEANNGVADASLKSQAQQYGMVIETDKAGKAIVKSMKEAEGATQNVGKAAVATADSIREMADAGWDANKDLVAQARAHNAAMAKVETSWIDASVAASKYSQEMAAVVWGANKNIEAMTREHALLVAQMEALAQQQEQLEGRGNDAAKGVDDLRLRLLELNGTEEEIARARNERDKAEVQRKMALMQIDLQRAQVSNKTEDATRLQAELDLLAEQLKLLDQIYREEEKQRKARERDGGGERGGSKGGRSGGDGGGVVTAPAPTVVPGPISITLNANGINDPVRLARMIEPELARLARLAR